MAKRKRRAFTTEFKAEAVRLVRDSGKSVGRGGADLTESAVRHCARPRSMPAGGQRGR
jgi:transposase